MVRPMTDLGLHLADMAAWPEEGQRREWLRANDSFRRYVLDLLRDSGPLLSRDVPDRSVVRNPRCCRRSWSARSGCAPAFLTVRR